jgi:hypothetical protein
MSMDPYLRARFEQAEYERRFVQDQRDAALLAAPVYQQYANQAAHGAPSALDEIAKLPVPPRRGADGKIVSRAPAAAPAERAAPARALDLEMLAGWVQNLAAQVTELREMLEVRRD